MDIDPKPKDEQPTVPPAEPGLPEAPEATPDTTTEESSFNMPDSMSESPAVESSDSIPVDTAPAVDAAPKPTGTPNPVIAAALNQEAAEDKEPQTQPTQPINPASEKKSRRGLIIGILIVVILGAGVGVWYVLYGSTPAPTTNNTSTESNQETVEVATAETTDAIIDEAVEALEVSATEEKTLAETDDSASVIDASTDVESVGDSVNESNF